MIRGPFLTGGGLWTGSAETVFLRFFFLDDFFFLPLLFFFFFLDDFFFLPLLFFFFTEDDFFFFCAASANPE
ncbi:MAG TPA: hypothetical protein EYN39_06780 [Deltaproteobacteria bacterium]|nr:hypothetical protein [Deltaproteobacteria bacterium]